MNIKKSLYFWSLNFLFLFLFVCITGSSFSQTFGRYGLKAGLILSGASSTDEKIVPSDNTFFVNYLNFDIGGYAELFNTNRFCVSAEIHYEIMGENNPNFTKVVYEETLNGEKIYRSKFLNDRFHFLSFQVFPRYRFAIAPSGENMYVFGGPAFNLLLSSSNSADLTNTMELKNFRFDIGGNIGLGVNLVNFLTLEFRFEHYFTGPYRFSFGDESAKRVLNLFTFLTGIAVNKL